MHPILHAVYLMDEKDWQISGDNLQPFTQAHNNKGRSAEDERDSSEHDHVTNENKMQIDSHRCRLIWLVEEEEFIYWAI